VTENQRVLDAVDAFGRDVGRELGVEAVDALTKIKNGAAPDQFPTCG